MKKRMRTYIIAGVCIAILVFLTSPRLRQLIPDTGAGRSTAERDGRIQVTAVQIRPETVNNMVRANGTVMANEEVDLRSEMTGKVEKIYFSEGSRVRKGELLIKLDDSELRAERSKLESQRKVLQEKERRRKQLLEKQSISPEDYEAAQNELNSIIAEGELIEAKIRKTELRAPFDGLIGLRYVSEGSYVSPDIRIASLQNVSIVKVDFSVPERYARAVRKGQPIEFRVSGLPEMHRGKIFAVEPKIDPVTRNVLLRAICPNDEGHIIPGAFAEVELVLEQISDALMIPSEALVPDIQGQKVYICQGGFAREVRVEIGLRTDTRVQVTRGLHPSDTVLTSGLLQVVPGSPVKLTEVL
jgi:membrane fusion protein (multidrug efflux system)